MGTLLQKLVEQNKLGNAGECFTRFAGAGCHQLFFLLDSLLFREHFGAGTSKLCLAHVNHWSKKNSSGLTDNYLFVTMLKLVQKWCFALSKTVTIISKKASNALVRWVGREGAQYLTLQYENFKDELTWSNLELNNHQNSYESFLKSKQANH